MQNIKVVFVGDSGVGKSYLKNKCAGLDPASVDPSWDNQNVILTVDKMQVNIGLWDTKGVGDYDRLRPLSYPCTDVFFVCFSLVSSDSLENVSLKWIPEVQHHMPHTTIILVGTKRDMRDNPLYLEQLQEKPVSFEEGKRKAKDSDLCGYVECSAVTGDGVQELLDMAVQSICHQSKRGTRQKKCTIM